MQEKNKTAFLDVLRWAATIDVILYHILNAAVSYVEIDRGGVMGFNLIAVPMRWHVPMFLMISGALFLNPAKEISIRKLYSKNIRRLALALGLFGYVFALLEIYFNTHTVNAQMFIKGIYNLITGNTWSHMWYLYMLIGIYMLVPALKVFSDNAPKYVKRYVILILFVFLSIFPEIEEIFDITIGLGISIVGHNLLYFLLGDYCMHELDSSRSRKKGCFIGIVAALSIVIMNAVFEWGFHLGTSSPVMVILTVSIFVLCKDLKLSSEFLSKYKYLTFGMYLVHMVFINIAYKVLHISPFDYPLLISVPLFGVTITVLSLIFSYLMNVIPPLRRYVL